MSEALRFLAEELEKLKAQGLFRLPRVVQGRQRARAVIDGREVVNLSSNNYLGLATHPRLQEAARRAVESHGVGSGAVRTIAGTQDLHQTLEEVLARFKRTEAVLVYQSGFTANAGTVAAILAPGDVVVSDELNHASIIDGCRLSRATIKVYPHADMEGLRQKLEEARRDVREGGRTLVVTDGVFSMDGDIAPLPDVVRIAREFGAITMVDDAHASGVLGDHGRGSVDHWGLHGQVDIQVGTLSKAVGVLGGYVAGSRTLIEYLLQRARPILFSTSHPPAVTAACIEAIHLMEESDELIRRLWENTRLFQAELRARGFDTGRSQTPITPVIVGEETKAMALSDQLFQEGVFAQGIAYPTVPRGKARVRAIVTAEHSQADLEEAVAAFARVGKRLGIIG
ncbi:glycine C-acetyltransferase [Limnochorda pilosa]|uniref:8-amino-7-ketopelargonate synthase n=1 Tax=Limnochorda pilosa TaxID=1555112 RepID=A0A0K2SG12_LIMPI|nr:glycine C-acetyltransferase [Limnochorda pilosa]BAS26043.1 2-amino-3-ketobutyrate CoA ligase [Limnochorda pilosa]